MGLKTVLVDIDGTISDPSHRLHLIPQDRTNSKGWQEFGDACSDDAPIQGMIDISNAIAERYYVFIVTSRSETVREKTEEWLKKHRVNHHGVLMREEGDFRPSEQVKEDIIKKLVSEGAEIIGFFDDHEGNISSASKFGFPTMRVKA